MSEKAGCFEAGCFILLIFATFFTVVPFLATYQGWPVSLLNRDVGYDTPMDAHLTQILRNRSHRSYYFDENNAVQYFFYDFRPASSRLLRTELTRAAVAEGGLGPYLREGDYLTKAAHDTVLAVHRLDRTTYWVCPAPKSGAAKR